MDCRSALRRGSVVSGFPIRSDAFRTTYGWRITGKGGTPVRLGHLFAWGGLLLALMVTSAQAERRLAFVAGVNAYSNLPANMQLERAVADAETVSTTLQELGFSVTKLTAGVTHEAFLRRFGAFTAQIEPGDTVLVFFAEHGVGLGGTNYLLPADVPLPGGGDERLVRNRSIAETDLIEDVRGRGARV